MTKIEKAICWYEGQAKELEESAGIDPDWDEHLDNYRIALSALYKATEYEKAEREGRLTILPPPAREGDPVPDCFCDVGAGLWCVGYMFEGDGEPTPRCRGCWYCDDWDGAGDDETEARTRRGTRD